MAGGDFLVIFVLANLVALFGTMLFATVTDLVDGSRLGRRPPR